MNSIFMKLYVTWPTWPKGHIPQKFEFLNWFLQFLDWWKNIIFNKTESFVWKNTSDHACQIFCSKSNWNYVSLIFPPRDNRGQNNEQSVFSAHTTPGPGLRRTFLQSIDVVFLEKKSNMYGSHVGFWIALKRNNTSSGPLDKHLW